MVGKSSHDVEEMDVNGLTVQLMDKIAEMKTFHDSFEPRRRRMSTTSGHLVSFAGEPKGGNKKSAMEEMMASEARKKETERRAERLEAYKMVRKVEPELPPLSPLTSTMSGVLKVRSDGIIKWHVSTDFLQNCTREARRDALENQKEEKMRRSLSAASYREDALARQHSELQEVWLRKKQQAKNAMMKQKEPPAKKHKFDEFFLERWLTMYAVARLNQNMFNILESAKVQKQKQVLEKRMLVLPKTDDAMTAHFRLLVCMCWRYVRVKRARNDMRLVYQSLKGWKVAGRCFYMFKRFAKNIVNLQRWWRSVARRLKDTRERISRRWERIERAELHRELLRRQEDREKDKQLIRRPTLQSHQQPKLSIEEKIELERVDEATRLRFIEQELRARRYFLLPQIHLYEMEVRQWRQAQTDINETRKAHQALGLDVPTGTIFRWPPIRPSHVPGAHLQTEAKGTPCPEWCVGRRGDEEIMRMWRRCRKNPRGWTEIPVKATGGTGAKTKWQGAGVEKKPAAAAESVRLFGEATDEDLSRWGIYPPRMPSLRPVSGDGDGDLSRAGTAGKG